MKIFKVNPVAMEAAPKDLKAALAEAEKTGILKIPAEKLTLSLPGGKVEVKK